jgi:hypothetical protein
VIHKEFASFYSPVFKAAFNSNFLEGQTQKFRIVDTSESAACLLVHWLYTQKIDLAQIDEFLKEMSESDHLIRLYVLADRLLIGSLQDAVIHELEERSIESNSVNVTALMYVYENTSPDSKLRRLLLHQCASRLDSSTFTQSARLFPHEMLVELAVLYSKSIRSTEMKALMPRADMSSFEVSKDQPEEQSKVRLFSVTSS